jgi:hypothetical protein
MIAAFESNSSARPGAKSPLPGSSHIIMFIAVRFPMQYSEIPLILCPKEVGAAVWISKENLVQILAREGPHKKISGIEKNG